MSALHRGLAQLQQLDRDGKPEEPIRRRKARQAGTTCKKSRPPICDFFSKKPKSDLDQKQLATASGLSRLGILVSVCGIV
jgi:hypothetical protein